MYLASIAYPYTEKCVTCSGAWIVSYITSDTILFNADKCMPNSNGTTIQCISSRYRLVNIDSNCSRL